MSIAFDDYSKIFFLNQVKIKLILKKKWKMMGKIYLSQIFTIILCYNYFYIAWNTERIIIDLILKIDIHLFIKYFNFNI